MVDPEKWGLKLGVAPRFAAAATGVGWLLAAVALSTAFNGNETDAVTYLVRPVIFAGVATLFSVLWWSAAGNRPSRRVGAIVMCISMIGFAVLTMVGFAATFWGAWVSSG